MVGAEWYAANGPDPTPLRRSTVDEIACTDVSSGCPAEIFTDDDTSRQVAQSQQLTFQLMDGYITVRPYAREARTLLQRPSLR
eukprot:11214518-Karenia_brevis.AAC.1